jgi:GMP synthase-like glutamine amidotransferase
MRLHWIQHAPFEGLGAIESWVDARGHDLSATRMWCPEPLPAPSDYDGLIVMGGPMSVHDETQHRWLVAEKRFVEQAIHADKPILGVCLGAQMIAHVLGARVVPNAFKEIGWFPVSLTGEARRLDLFRALPDRFDPFHWHGETFDVPHGATRAAFSQACPNQAFLYGSRVLALQFHLEMTREGIQTLVDHCSGDLVTGPYVEPAGAMLNHSGAHARAHGLLEGLLDRLFVA